MEGCTQVDKIRNLEGSVARIEGALWKGNSKPSIVETLTELHVTMKILSENQLQTNENTAHLTTAINGLLRFQESVESEKRTRASFEKKFEDKLEDQMKKTRWAIGILVTISLAFVSFIGFVLI